MENPLLPVCLDDDTVYIIPLGKLLGIALFGKTRRAVFTFQYEPPKESDVFEGDDFDCVVDALNHKFGWNLYE